MVCLAAGVDGGGVPLPVFLSPALLPAGKYDGTKPDRAVMGTQINADWID